MRKTKKEQARHYCRECAHVEYLTAFHTLSVKGEPTLGACPFREWRVLLCDRACPNFVEKVLIK